ncbi:MAG: serine/threonine-protein kinase [Pseudomonadota bacterium]
MTAFPESPSDDYAMVYLESTDAPLPEKINPATRYAYFKTIAKGGKAIIKSCKDLHLSRVVCYKSLKPEFADDPVEQKRFMREARVSAMLQHPNTIPMYELGRDSKGHMYFTMKLVHGYTLREILDYRERYDLKQLINVVIQVAHGLDYAHSHRVIHRDIKPENILVGPFGEVLIMDWGLAKVWTEDGATIELTEQVKFNGDEKVTTITDMEKLQGTILYMSPEQATRNPNIDYRSDIYSLGAVIYEILSGQPPFDAEYVDEMLNKIANDAPVMPSELSHERIPDLLETVALQCLSKSPENRISNCAELVRLLEEDW